MVSPEEEHTPTRRWSRRRRVACIAGAALAAAVVLLAVWSRQSRGTSPCNTRDACARGCDGGDGVSCNRLATMSRLGLGGEGDWTEAYRRDRQACEGVRRRVSSARAPHDQWSGTRRDPQGAREILVQSCEHGSPRACEFLSDEYRRGASVSVDVTKADAFAARALSLSRQGCDRGDGDACHILADRIRHGEGTAKDEAQARAADERGVGLQKRACDGGDVVACLEVPEEYSEDGGAKERTRGSVI